MLLASATIIAGLVSEAMKNNIPLYILIKGVTDDIINGFERVGFEIKDD